MKISDYQYVLCSAFARVKDILVEQNILLPWNAKVGFIANAADLNLDEHWKVWWNERDREALESLGYEIVHIDLKQENENSLLDILFQLDAVFVWWGNVFYLLYWMNVSWFSRIIHEYLEKGWLYLSTSAGSCVAAPDIEYVKCVDDASVVNLESYKGLCFCNVAINPHFDRSSIMEDVVPICNFFLEHDLSFPCLHLTDQQAVVWNLDGMFRVIS